MSDAELIISVTSYPPRFETLAGAIRSLLFQSVKVDRIILFVGNGERALLPTSVCDLEQAGLEIRETADLGPFTKLVPALTLFPDALIATADDDVVYPTDWAQSLLEGHRRQSQAVICHRAHRMRYLADDLLAPYEEWDLDVQDESCRTPSYDLVATGVGGVLYPPRCLHEHVFRAADFLRLCPTGDDLWFHWMAALVGTPTLKVGGRFQCKYTPGSQKVALWHVNRAWRNDLMITALTRRFGSPRTMQRADQQGG
jgi:hypothetical protein